MKSVLRSIELRLHDAESLSDTADSSSSTSSSSLSAAPADAVAAAVVVLSTSEQLAELKLLSRVELENAPLLSTAPDTLATVSGDTDSKPVRRDTGRVEKKSTFTALLGASSSSPSSHVTTSGSNSSLALPSIAAAAAGVAPTVCTSQLPSAPAPMSPTLVRGTSERFRRTSALPTLREEPLEDAACTDDVHARASVSNRSASDSGDGHDDNGKDTAAATPDDPASVAPLDGENDSEDSDAPPPEDSSSSDDEDDEAFAQMLAQLPHDAGALALSVPDLTSRRLAQVHAALLAHSPAAEAAAMSTRQASESVDERAEAPVAALVSTLDAGARMRHVRAAVAVDTIRLLLERCGRESVVAAITAAVRAVFAQYAAEGGVEPLAHLPAVVTSRNIARVVLQARASLVESEQSPQSNHRHCLHRGADVARSTLSRERRPPHQLQLRPSALTVPLTGSSRRSESPRSSHSPSRDSPGTRPLTPQPRSILASDGDHVLMQEKLSAFQHRGAAGGSSSGLALFKVRRDGAAVVQAAALRRSRSIAYGKEQTRKAALK